MGNKCLIPTWHGMLKAARRQSPYHRFREIGMRSALLPMSPVYLLAVLRVTPGSESGETSGARDTSPGLSQERGALPKQNARFAFEGLGAWTDAVCLPVWVCAHSSTTQIFRETCEQQSRGKTHSLIVRNTP